MPRDGAGNYTTPPGTEGSPGLTIESARYNNYLADVALEFNSARPIIAGGTGGTTREEALASLHAERAWQTVTDYDTHIFYPGSFTSAASATHQPVAGHAFMGFCYVGDPAPINPAPPANINLSLEARDMDDTVSPGKIYVRQKKAGVWSAWQELIGSSGGPISNLTTNLHINKVGPSLFLNKPASGVAGGSAALIGSVNDINRWILQLGDQSAESGTLIGDDCTLSACSSTTGTAVSPPYLKVERATGDMTMTGNFRITPVTGNSTMVMNKPVGNFSNAIIGRTQSVSNALGLSRWTMQLGDASTEAGGQTGSNFMLNIHNDAGVFAGTTAMQFSRATAACNMGGTLSVNGAAFKPGGGSWSDSSDARIKTVTGDYTQGLLAIRHLRPRTFTYRGNEATIPEGWNDNEQPIPGRPHPRSPHRSVVGYPFIGLVAQEAEDVMPELVTRRAAEIDGRQVSDLRMLDASALIYALINACKELAERIETLETAHEAGDN